VPIHLGAGKLSRFKVRYYQERIKKGESQGEKCQNYDAGWGRASCRSAGAMPSMGNAQRWFNLIFTTIGLAQAGPRGLQECCRSGSGGGGERVK
jgi:hypothetical protein